MEEIKNTPLLPFSRSERVEIYERMIQIIKIGAHRPTLLCVDMWLALSEKQRASVLDWTSMSQFTKVIEAFPEILNRKPKKTFTKHIWWKQGAEGEQIRIAVLEGCIMDLKKKAA